MVRLFAILMFIEVVLIIWFPSISLGGQTAYYTLLMYPIIIITLIWNYAKDFLKNDSIGKAYLKIIFTFIILTIIGSIGSSVFSTNTYNDLKVIFSYVIWIFYAFVFYIICENDTISRYIKCAIILSAFTLGLYSVYSYFTFSNVYVDYFAVFFNNDLNINQFADYSEARGISFRVFGNINNPVYFSGELMLLLAFTCYEFCNTSKKQYKLFLVISIITIMPGVIFTGSKSGIIPSFAIIIYTIYHQSRSTLIILRILLGIVILMILFPIIGNLINVDLNRFFTALNPFVENVGGSNVMHRGNQFEYLFEFVGTNFLFGNGIGWCRYYNDTKGIHIILHTFESIIMSSYAEGGLWGLLFVYPMFMVRLYKLRINHSAFPFYRVVLLSFYFFIIATGMGMIKYFFIWISVLLADYKKNRKYLYNEDKNYRNVSATVSLYS